MCDASDPWPSFYLICCVLLPRISLKRTFNRISVQNQAHPCDNNSPLNEKIRLMQKIEAP